MVNAADAVITFITLAGAMPTSPKREKTTSPLMGSMTMPENEPKAGSRPKSLMEHVGILLAAEAALGAGLTLAS